MDTQKNSNHTVSRMFFNILIVAIIMAMTLPATVAAKAGPPSPFVGKWEAVDLDGSSMDMSIGGSPDGPFQITWRDQDIALCDGAPGILRGTGLLNESDPDLLEADLLLECFTTGATLNLQLAFRYQPETNTLLLAYSFGEVTIWYRPGKQPAVPPELNLRLIAFPKVDEVFGYGFPEGSQVTLTINGQFIQTVTVGPSGWDPNDIGAFFTFGDQHDLAAGEEVMLSSRGMEIRHIVRSLDVTGLDAAADIVFGTADPGVEVFVYPFEYGDQALSVIAGEDGAWQADFAAAGIDLLGGMSGRVDTWDEFGSSTTVDWQIPSPPSPRMIAFPKVDEVYGYNFPLGSEVTLMINGQPIQTVTVGPSGWNPDDIGAFFSFSSLHDLLANDEVILSGSGMEIRHVVRNLDVTGLDAVTDRVTGTADPFAEVSVYPFEYGDQALSVIAGEDGAWQADFAAAGIDLVEGMPGRVDTWDEFGSSTTVDWLIPWTE